MCVSLEKSHRYAQKPTPFIEVLLRRTFNLLAQKPLSLLAKIFLNLPHKHNIQLQTFGFTTWYAKKSLESFYFFTRKFLKTQMHCVLQSPQYIKPMVTWKDSRIRKRNINKRTITGKLWVSNQGKTSNRKNKR